MPPSLWEQNIKRPGKFLKDLKAKTAHQAPVLKSWFSKLQRIVERETSTQPVEPSPPPQPLTISALSAASYEAVGFTKGKLPLEISG